MSKYLAIDIGASSGRAIVADLTSALYLDEINRFDIDIIRSSDERLNLNKLSADINQSIQIALEKYEDIESIGIDTWAVDTVAIDHNGMPVSNPMFYRDESFVNSLNDYSKANDLYELYQRTGIQIQAFNTFFQMQVAANNYNIKDVSNFMMLPDYLAYTLCGVKSLEFTNATTTQSINLQTNRFECEHRDKFIEITNQRILGNLKPEFANGRSIKVVSVATHDTSSAILAIPHLQKSDAFLSSGTWSLLGKHVDKPIINYQAYEYNYSNEGNYDRTYRFQKNIMGLWVIVSYAKENHLEDFAELNELAKASTIESLIDINDQTFMNPSSMTVAIIEYCKLTSQEVPDTVGDFSRVIYRSLAHSYKVALAELEIASGEAIESLTIVGGGAKAQFLNEEIAKVIDQKLRLFPYECSALGNVLVQAIEMGQFNNLQEAHDYVSKHMKIYTQEKENEKFRNYKKRCN
ncbi:FGGY family carbohydrate kinase [Mollicutes bacterium LVI A0039]|nr:FGGY family carbohydrate kinase [Mollicutes bacterium LVI A0039]